MKEHKSFGDEELKNFMRNVTELRRHNGYSKKRMAELLGISIGTLSKMECGQFPPRLSVTVMYNVWKHFGVHVKDQFLPHVKF